MNVMVEPLSKRIDGLQRLVTARAVPILAQLRLMLARPFDDEPEGARRNRTRDDREVFDVDRGLVVAVPSVEMRPTQMVILVVIHPDHDAVESADPWHWGTA
jgi:hypothetical protein